MSESTVIDASPEPTVYVRYERKVSPEKYGEARASLSYPIVLTGNPADDAAAIDNAVSLAKQVVLDAVGVSFEAVNGKIVEQPFQGQADVPAQQSYSNPPQSAPQAPGNVGGPVDFNKFGDPNEKRPCPVCGADTFNNRKDKAVDEAKAIAQGDTVTAEKIAKRPDFKCTQYRNPPKGTGCKGVVWHSETT